MAEFNQAYAITSAHEGGYVNDPDDRGGETYRGIARVHHPEWSGWRRVDAQRRKAGFPKSLDADRTLQNNVKAFYKAAYWDRFKGDDIPDQAVGNELYDTAVNMGVRRAVRFLQSSLNLLNRNQSDYEDLIVDGLFGAKTLGTLEKLLKKDRNSDALVKMMNIQQGARYVEIMASDASQERFARGWIKRA
jgi:lysozyme family protein